MMKTFSFKSSSIDQLTQSLLTCIHSVWALPTHVSAELGESISRE